MASDWISKAVFLRKSGRTYQEIGKELGIARHAVHEALRGQGGFSCAQIEEMRERYVSGEALTTIAKDYSIDETAVSDIALGITYKDCPGPISEARRGSKLRPDARMLSPDDVKVIRNLAGLVSTREMAHIYGCSRGLIRRVIARKIYKDIDDD